MSKQEVKQKIKQLISEYESLKRDNALKDKKEAFTKQRFIQPFFEALGWDFRTDVWPEESVSKDRVDYAFKIGGFIKFFVEAKKFSVDLEEEKWAEQAIDYAYNKSVTWAVLTDFEGLKIFNSEWNKKPFRSVKEFTYKEYLARFDEIWLLSKESFEKGELDRRAEEWGVKERKIPITEQLAQDLTEWRDSLRKEIEVWNKGKYPEEQIDEAVQRFLDRLIFIRYAEDKGLEPPTLEPILKDYKKYGGDLIKKLNKVFRQFDDWYDSRLFEKHFSEEMEAYSGKLEKIIKGLYRSKESGHPYDFSAISSDVLGAVYEQYLGYLQKKKTENKKISKRKEQGIYYTPSFIVDYIVQNTLGNILGEETKSEIKNIKILDPACGSGSFLIKAYQKLIDYYQKEINHKIDTKSKLGKIEKLIMEKKGIQELSVAQKLNILRENIYGVDLDPKAVEIAQLNLLLKAIAKRTKLPNLSHKIVCGNSLISGDEKKLKSYFGIQWKEKKPFNWGEEFDEVFQNREEYDGQAYHITWVTHNSRVSERMVQFGVERGEPLVLNEDEEIEITKYISQIVHEYNQRVLNYNICRDHVHMILMCDEDERDNIVRKLKGKSAQLYKQSHGLKEEFHLWAQKYSWTIIENDEQMANTMEYIQHNREKHNLSRNKELQPLVASMITPFADAFEPAGKQGGFDVIIGNPPYVQLSMEEKLPNGLKEFLLDTYESSMGRLNTFGFFIRRGIELLKDSGYLGYIIPNTILTQDYYEELRKYILDNCTIESIVSFDNLPFKDAIVENVVLILKKITSERMRNNHKVAIYKMDENFSFVRDKSITQKSFIQSHKYSFNVHLSEGRLELKKKFEENTRPLSAFVEINQAIALKHERAKYLSKTKESSNYKPVIDGRNIGRYFVKWDNTYLRYDINAIHSCKREDIFLTKEKLFFRRVGDRLIGAYDDKQMYALNTLIAMNLKEGVATNIKFLLALFNSKLLNWYYQAFLKSTKKVFSEIQARQVAQIPIKDIDLNNNEDKRKHDKIVSLANELIALSTELQKLSPNTDKHNSLKREIEKLDHEIDEEVYKLYGLNQEEIRIIENYGKD